MVTKNRVDWTDERLGSNVYEDMVSVLISRLHPQAERIDGAGGDKGRDVQVPLPAGLEIFELKSFTGRLDERSGRRRQVADSLKRAAERNPTAWHLVVPINHTDGELEWFNGLAAKYSFPCDWRGKDWLDSQMASHPELPRYYLEGSNDEIVNMMRELNQEQAALTRGVSDLVERVRTLKDRLNSLDPHYVFGFNVQPNGSVSVTTLPRYPGAQKDRPIRIGGTFEFPDTEDGKQAARALQDSFDYGATSVVSSEFVKSFVVDAPAEFGGIFEGGELQVGGAVDNAPLIGARFALRIRDAQGVVRAHLPLEAKERTAGKRGIELRLEDLGGVARVKARFDAPTHRAKITYSFHLPEDSLPGILLPAVRFLAEATEGRAASMVLNGKEIGPPMDLSSSYPDAGDSIKQLQILDDIQRISGVYFPVPQSLTDEEFESIRDAHRYLTSETCTFQWSRVSFAIQRAGLDTPELQQLQAGGAVSDFVIRNDMILRLGDDSFNLGRLDMTFSSVVLEVIVDIDAAEGSGGMIKVTIIPGEDSSVSVSLVR
ncbi:hypothetical protein [Streptomyces narbonensis]|uniref:hypothetical protein n=1 Tax=Streptomyces narbonensis TaxID=67333 RepID=UPI001675701B|nr:hypothetical protein [Streptomyces narbonensis]GGV98078.1 hypothetical protein GCM10010230_20770 [Streptomyces narbonensis]